ncbi:MAG: PD-(D/E)XK nuclease family protein [Rikenellaceae bacterium]
MVELENIEALLIESSEVVKKYGTEAQESGSEFNFISVINEEKKEDLHSRIITELINPQGSHGAGALFLKPFFENVLLGEKYCDNSKYFVKREHYIGALNNKEDKPTESSGGKIDIYIEGGGGKKIAIENKIDAVDQKHQIRRYYNYTNNTVYYLTLDGKMPSLESCGDKPEHSYCKLNDPEHFKRISYEDNILKWLAECEELADEKSELVVIIRQYIRIVKKITYKMSEMENKINKLLESDRDFLKAAYEISNVIQKRKAVEQDKLRDAVCSELKELGEDAFIEEKQIKVEIGKRNEAVLHWVAGVKDDFYYMITINGGDKDECIKLLEVEKPDSRPHIIKIYGNQCGVNFSMLNTITPETAKEIAKEAIGVIEKIRASLNIK